MKKIVAAVFFLLVASFIIYASPYYTVAQIKKAAVHNDYDSISDYVNYPEFKESIQRNFHAIIKESGVGSKAVDPLKSLGILLAASVMTPIIDEFSIPENIGNWLTNEVLETETTYPAMQYANWKRFEAIVIQPLSGRHFVLIFKRDGILSWELSGIKLPVKEIVEESRKKDAARRTAIEKKERERPHINPENITGRFMLSSQGRLFVIDGHITIKAEKRAPVQLKGILGTKYDKRAKTKTVYAGNIVPEDVLETGDMEAIYLTLLKKTPVNHPDNKPIPFMIVFNDLPPDLENYIVELVK